jgi:hypothetical protein
MARSAEKAKPVKARDALSGWLVSAACGIGLWGSCRALNSLLGFRVAFSPAALACCAALGLPGAIALLLARGIFLLI